MSTPISANVTEHMEFLGSFNYAKISFGAQKDKLMEALVVKEMTINVN